MKIAESVIAIGSGKGGVGKSTLSVNLAVALAQKGIRVALLDADLYGPSIPIMMGLRQLSPRQTEDGRVIPFTKYGVHTLSIGFFLEERRSILWRGPMLHQMLQKMLTEVAWPKLDLLLIDLPPGTGDVPLSLSKLITITSALVVTTPQAVAVHDVIKAIHAFDQFKIPLLGLIENFSGYQAADGSFHYPFGKGGGQQLAADLSIPCLGTIPIQETIRIGGDEGVCHPKLFTPLAENLLNRLDWGKKGRS